MKEKTKLFLDEIHAKRSFGIPIDLNEIVSLCGGKIVFVSGADYTAKTENNTIYVCSGMSQNRTRFAIAHSLFHFLMNEDVVDNVKNYSLSIEGSEAEANEFAMNLLIPHQDFEFVIKRIKEKDLLKYLSQMFGVSEALMGVKANSYMYGSKTALKI